MEKSSTEQLLIALIEREGYGPAEGSTALWSLNMDSLEFVQLIQAIRSEIGPITSKAVQEANTVSELAAAIGERVSA